MDSELITVLRTMSDRLQGIETELGDLRSAIVALQITKVHARISALESQGNGKAAEG